MDSTRRKFLQLSAVASLAGIISSQRSIASPLVCFNANPQERDLVFLFQGDSITDGNRGRSTDPNHIMGHGYAFSIASRIAADYAENNFTFFNRGISGNKIPDLQARWQKDTVELKPDVFSLLIGINDVAAVVNKSDRAQTVEEFETGYRDLLQQVKVLNKDALFVLGLPFVYPVGRIKDKFDVWQSEVEKRAAVVRKLAAEFNAVLVDYPAAFEKSFKQRFAEYWIWDGIHPTIAGHEIMAREWIKQVSKRLKFLKKYKF